MRYNKDAGKAERDQELFDTIAKNYGSKDIYGSSRAARSLRVMQTLRKVNLEDHAHVLEVGCGAGFSAEYLRGCYSKYMGIDYSKELINIARKNNRSKNVEFYATDFYDFASKSLYDVVIMIGVLHHMSDPSAAIRKSLALLKSGGYLVVNEPQSANVIFQSLRHFRAKTDNSYSVEQEQFGAAELFQLFSESGFANVKCYPQGFFSTPFAEVVLSPQLLTIPISRAACALDHLLERSLARVMKRISWNIIVLGRK